MNTNLPGHVENGVIVLDGAAKLPEGTLVDVSLRAATKIHVAAERKQVELPIFPYDGPPDIELTNDQIAEILDEEDASP